MRRAGARANRADDTSVASPKASRNHIGKPPSVNRVSMRRFSSAVERPRGLRVTIARARSRRHTWRVIRGHGPRPRPPRGFDLAYAAYGARVHAFLLRLSGRSDVADDLLQHTFLRLAERGPELRADSDLRAWLFTVARNAYLGQARAPGNDRDDGALEGLASPPPDVEARLLLGGGEPPPAPPRLRG